ncbi:MAG: DUF4389 domain-containing protein, partial [Dehalococcoidia bacterium]|nr:DUF4389 domain-containing protein [Dehalococcoidia bacterium]
MTTTLAAAPPAYPVRLEVDYPQRQSRWLALLRVFLLIPPFVFLYLLQNSVALAIIAAVLVSGRIPRWLFDFQVAFNRWALRFAAYALLLTDEYPPFEAGYSVRYEVDYPQQSSRWRLVIWKVVTAAPQLVVLAVLFLTLVVVVPIGWFAVLISGRFPEGLHRYAAGVLRWAARVWAYVYSLTDEFPPFSLSAEAGPGGRHSYIISAMLGSVITALWVGAVVAGIVIAALSGPREERLEVDYEDVATGQDVETQVEVDSISVTLPGINDPADLFLEPLFFPQRRHRFVEFLVIIENDGDF